MSKSATTATTSAATASAEGLTEPFPSSLTFAEAEIADEATTPATCDVFEEDPDNEMVRAATAALRAILLETIDDDNALFTARFNSMEFDADNEGKRAATAASRTILLDSTDESTPPAPKESSSNKPREDTTNGSRDTTNSIDESRTGMPDVGADSWCEVFNNDEKLVTITHNRESLTAMTNTMTPTIGGGGTPTLSYLIDDERTRWPLLEGDDNNDEDNATTTTMGVGGPPTLDPSLILDCGNQEYLLDPSSLSNQQRSTILNARVGAFSVTPTPQRQRVDDPSLVVCDRGQVGIHWVDSDDTLVADVERDSIIHVPDAILVVERDEEVYIATTIEPRRRFQCFLGVMFLIVTASSVAISQRKSAPPVIATPTLPSATCVTDPACGATFDTWTTDFSSFSVVELMSGTDNMARQPQKTERLDSLLEAPANSGDNFGSRLHGWLVPPVTGEYDFFIASQGDVGGLWLSFDDHLANVNIVCVQPDHYGVRDKEFLKYAEQRSNPISLVEGQAYYYEVSVLQDLIECLFLDTHSSLLLAFNLGPLGI